MNRWSYGRWMFWLVVFSFIMPPRPMYSAGWTGRIHGGYGHYRPHPGQVQAASSDFIASYSWETWFLSAAWGLTHVRVATPAQKLSRIAPANLALTAGVSHALSPSMKIEIALTSAAPLALLPGSIPDNRATEEAYRNAVASSSFSRFWLWSLNTVPVLARSGLTVLQGPIKLKIRSVLGGAVSVNSRSSYGLFALSTELSYRWLSWRPGISAMYLRQGRPFENLDLDQSGSALFIDYIFGSWSTRVTTYMNIDPPFGLLSQTPKPSWGVELSVGKDY